MQRILEKCARRSWTSSPRNSCARSCRRWSRAKLPSADRRALFAFFFHHSASSLASCRPKTHLTVRTSVRIVILSTTGQRIMPREIPKAYEPQLIEQKWAKKWAEEKLFRADVNAPGPVFSIVIPPPNVTGSLHIGHMLDHTEIDILTRWRRMQRLQHAVPAGHGPRGNLHAARGGAPAGGARNQLPRPGPRRSSSRKSGSGRPNPAERSRGR